MMGPRPPPMMPPMVSPSKLALIQYRLALWFIRNKHACLFDGQKIVSHERAAHVRAYALDC